MRSAKRFATAIILLASCTHADAQSCTAGLAGVYPCNNVDLLSFVPLDSVGGTFANDVWGWTDPGSGREFGILGLSTGTAFVEVTDPFNPVYLGTLPSQTGSSAWRDMKVHANHAYIVSDGNGPHGVQVLDLSQLLSVVSPPVAFDTTAWYTAGIGSAHNIAINEDTGYGYVVGSSTCSGGLHFVNIQNPENPTDAGCFSLDGYTHDVQCVVYSGPDADHVGKEICVASNEDTITIVDVTNKAAPVQLSRTGYPGAAYTHQGWLTEDQRYFLLGDELDESNFGHNSRIRIWDVTDLDDPIVSGIYDGPTTAIDHNLYVSGNQLFAASYRAGLRILDLTSVSSGTLSEVGFFDVYPSSDAAAFNGAWSSYPYFASGTILVSSMQEGLFVLRQSVALPVEFSSFEALVVGADIELNWLTASETNNAGFAVEHAAVDREFDDVGYVDGHGTSAEPTAYRFTVNDLDPGLQRFRLKQIDFDGAFEYSAIIEASVTVPDRFLIEPAYPNPFNPTTTLRFAVAAEQHVEVTLVNAAGQLIRTLYSGTVAANEMQHLTVDAATLPSGSYLVHFEGNGLSATEQIVLMK